MNCGTCADKGIVTLNWADAPDDYAICLCEQGQSMRRTTNEGRTVPARWQVWCAREQVDPSRMFLIEEVLTPAELRERGLAVTAPAIDREAALAAAGRRKR